MKKLVRFYGKEQPLYPSVTTNICKQESNFRILNRLSTLNSFAFQLLKAGLMVLAFCLLGTIQSNAQLYDLNLSQSVDKDSVGIDDTVIFTLTVNHEAGATASGIVVTDSISNGLTDIMIITPIDGTATYDAVTRKITWNLPSLDAITDDETELMFSAKVIDEGIHFNIAEITTSNFDSDSEADNGNYLEDDIAATCVSVPIKMCTAIQDSVLVSAPAGATNVQWYRIHDFGGDGAIGVGDTMALAVGNDATIDSVGTYFFTATLGSCQAGNCCPLMIEPACMDLALTKMLTTTGAVIAGDTVEFLVKVYNQGAIYSDSILLSDYLPNDLNPVVENGWTIVGPGDTTATKLLTIAGGEIAAGGLAPLDSVSTSIRAVIDADFEGTSLVNYAEISNQTDIYGNDLADSDSQDDANRVGDGGGEPEGVTDNVTDNSNGDEDDHDPALVTVTQVYDLALTKVLAESGPFAAGDTVTFRIYVYNQGTLDALANTVTVQDYIPADMNLVDLDWNAADTSYTFTNLIAAGGVDSVDIDLEIDPSFMGTSITNNAEIIADGGDDNDSTPDDEDGSTPDEPGDDDDTSETNGDDDYDFANVPVGQTYDLALTKVLAESGPFAAGDTVTFRIYVYNQGTLDALANTVKVQDYIPADMNLVDLDWNAADTSYTFTNLIAAGGVDSVDIDLEIDPSFMGTSITNNAEIIADGGDDNDSTPDDEDGSTPDEPGDDNDIAETNGDDDYDFANVPVGQTYDLALTKVLAESGPFAAGDTVTFRIYVYNQGTLDALANTVTVQDYIPADMNLVDLDWNAADTSYTFTNLIAAGGVDSVDIDLEIDPSFMGTSITNNAEIIADGGDDNDSTPDDEDGSTPDEPGDDDDTSETNGDDDYDFANVPVGQTYDLALTKVLAESGPFAAGDTVTFRIYVYNQGTLDALANTVKVQDYIPADMNLVDLDWNAADTSYTFTNLIAAGGVDSVDIDLEIDPSFMGTSITNNAEIIADGGDDNDSTPDDEDGSTPDEPGDDDDIAETNGDDDYDFANVPVGQTYDLALTKVLAESGPFAAGDTVTFRIYVYNQGTLDALANTVKVQDYIPADMNLVDLDWNAADTSYTFTNLIAAGGVDSVDIDLEIDPSFMGTSITNNAEIIADGGDDNDSTPDDEDGSTPDEPGDDNDIAETNGDDDYDFANVPVGQTYDLALTKVLAESGPFAAGDTVTFRIYVYNQGTLDALANTVTVQDYIPADMNLVDLDWNAADTSYTFTNLIAAGGVDSVDIDLEIDPSFMGTSITNNAEIIADGGDDNDSTPDDEDGSTPDEPGDDDDIAETNGDDDYDFANVPVGQTYDLALTKVLAESGPFAAGDTVTFRIYVYNQGTLDALANTVTVQDYIPTDMNLVDLDWNAADTSYTFTNLIAAGGVDSVDIDLEIDPSFMSTSITNNAEIIADGGDDNDSTPDDEDGSTPDEPGDDNDIAETNGDDDYDFANVPVGQTYDLALTKVLAESGPFAAGDTVTFRIYVYNQGTLDALANTVTVQDYIPADMNLVDLDWNAADTSYTFTNLIAAGGVDSVDIDLEIDPSFMGTSITNNAEIIADGGDDNDSTPDDEDGSTPDEPGDDNDIAETNGDDDYDFANVPVGQTYDLALTKVLAESGPFAAGDTVTFRIYVYNQGTIDALANTVTVQDYIPTDMNLVDLDWNAADTSYTFTNLIAAGGVDSVDIDLEIDPSFMGTSITNNAEIIADGGADNDSTPDDEDGSTPDEPGDDNDIAETNGDDDYDFANVPVGQTYDLALTKVLAESGPFAAGDTVTFRIYVYNQGTIDAAANTVTVQDYIPADMNLVDLDWNAADTSYTFTNLIAAGGVDSVDIDLEIDPSFMGTSITNNAEIIADGGADNDSTPDDEDGSTPDEPGDDDDTSETNGDDDYDFANVPVGQTYDLALTKVLAESGPFAAGDTVTFRIYVYNQGTIDALANTVTVQDYIPTDMNLVDLDWNAADTSYTFTNLIAAGGVDSVDIDLEIDPSFMSTSITNNAEIIADGGADNDSTPDDEDGSTPDEPGDDNDIAETNGDDDYDFANVPVGQTYDLALTKVLAESGPFAAGDTVTFRIYVYNQGTIDAAANTVTVQDYIPADMNLVDLDWNAADTSYTFTNLIAAGGVDSVDIDLEIDPSFMGTSITNNAEIIADGGADNDSTPDDEDGSTPDEPGDDDDTSETNGDDDYDFANVPVGQTYDLALTKVLAESGPFAAGDTVTFRIYVHNQGTIDAAGGSVEVTDYVPTGMTLVDADWTAGGTYTFASAIAAGGVDSVDIDLEIDASFMGTQIMNNAEITADGGDDADSAPNDNSGDGPDTTDPLTDGNGDPNTPDSNDDDYDSAPVNIGQVYDLALTKVLAESGPFAAGDTVTFRIYVHNQGTIDAAGGSVEVTDYVPTGMTLVDADWTAGGTYTFASAIAAGGVDSVDIDLEIDASFMGTQIMNNAEITADGGDDADSAPNDNSGDGPDTTDPLTDGNGDPNTPDSNDDDYDSAPVNIGQVYDLALTKVLAESGPFAAGDTVTFRIYVHNQGTIDAAGGSVEVTDYVPTGMTLVDADWTAGGTYTFASAIAAGGVDSVDIDLEIDASFMGTQIMNNAEITADGGDDADSAPNDNSGDGPDTTDPLTDGNGDPNTPDSNDDDYDSAPVNIGQVYDLALTKVLAESGPFTAGDTVTFRIYVHNQGTIDAAGGSVEVTDYVPTGMTLVDADWTAGGTYTFASAIAAGGVDSVDIDLEIDASFMGTQIMNNAEITADGGDDADSAPNDNSGDGPDTTDPLTDGNGDPNTPDSNDDDYDSAPVNIGQVYDLALTKVLSESGPFTAGDTVTFTIYVHNQGTIDAAGGSVEVTDYVPTGMTLVDADWTAGGTYTFASAIAAGGVDSVDIDLEIDASFMGTQIMNNAEITADGGDDADSAPNDNSGDGPDTTDPLTDGNGDPNTPDSNDDDYDSAPVNIGQVYDLALTKVLAESGPFAAGDTVTFRIYVHNQGTIDAAGGSVEVTDYVPTGMTLVDADWTAGGTYTFASAIAAGGVDSVDIDLEIDASFMGTQIMNNAEITADGGDDADSAPNDNSGDGPDTTDPLTDGNGDPNTPDSNDDDYDSAPVNIGQVYDLALTKVLSETGPFTAGDTVTFRIYVHNQGTIDAAGGSVEVTDYVPTGMTLVDADWTAGGTYTFASAIAAGGVDSVDIDLEIDASFMGTQIMNNAEITADGGDDTDSAPNDNSGDGPDTTDPLTDGNGDPNTPDSNDDDYDSAPVNIGQVYDLALTKVLSETGPFTAGDTVTFRIYVHNQGTIDAAGGSVEVTDYVPTGMTLVDADWTAGGTYTFASAIAAGGVDSVDIDLEIDASFMDTQIMNNAEITADGGDDADSAPNDNSGDGPDTTDPLTDGNGDPNTPDSNDDDYDSAPVNIGQFFDLALRKTLATGQSATVDLGDTVTFEITVFNQGTVDAYNIQLVEYLTTGLDFINTPAVNPGWFQFGASNPGINIMGPLAVGDSIKIPVKFEVNSGFTGTSITNEAEIANADDDTNSGNTPPTDRDSNDDSLPGDDVVDNEIHNGGGDEDDSDIEGITVNQIYDLALTKVVAENGPFAPGDTVTFRIYIHNQGTVAAATNTVVVEDYVPTGMVMADPDWTGNTYTFTNAIAAGGIDSVDVDVQIVPGFMGTSITNNAEIIADGGDDRDSAPSDNAGDGPDTANDDGTNDGNNDPNTQDPSDDDFDPATINVGQVYDLALTKIVAESGPFEAGDTITYRIYVFNQGTLDAAENTVIVEDYVPADMILADPDWTGNTHTFANAIAAGGVDSVDIDIQIAPSFMGTSITNNAEIIADGGDDADSAPGDNEGDTPDTSNPMTDGNDDPNTQDPNDDDYDPATVLIGQVYDLALTKALAQEGPFAPGDTVTFRIYVHNQGTVDAAANTVVVEDYVPTDMILADPDWVGSTYTFANAIAAGSMDSVDVDVQIAPSFRGSSITNNAEIIVDGGDDTDSAPADNTGDGPDTSDPMTDGNDDPNTQDPSDDDYDAEVINVQIFDLALKKVFAAGQVTSVSPGDTVAYTIWVYNQGNVDAYDINVNEYPATGLVYNAAINTGWSIVNGNIRHTIVGPLATGDSISMNINLIVDPTFTGTQIANIAEIESADDDGAASNDGPKDVDSTPNDNPNDDPYGGNNITDNTGGDEDDQDDEILTVVLSDFDLALTITHAPGQLVAISAGDTVETKVTIFNQGDIAADSIEITVLIPAGTALSSTYANGWTQINDSTLVILLTGTDLPVGGLGAGDMHMLPLFLEVDENFMETGFTVYAEISDDGENNDNDSTPDGDFTNDAFGGDNVTNNTGGDQDDHDPVSFTLEQDFDLALTKQLAAGQLSGVSPGDTVNYTITVYNQGSLDAYDVDVVDYIPTGMSLVPAFGWTNLDATTATNTIDFIGAGVSDSITISLMIDNTFAGTSITNNAEIAEAAQVDGGPAVGDTDSTPDAIDNNDGTPINNNIDNPADEDDSDFETIQVGIFDLALNKTLAAGQPLNVKLGETITYTITVKNEGIFDGHNIEVIDHIPNGMILSGADTNGWVASGTEASVTLPGILTPGDSVSVDIDLVLISGNPNSTIKNVAEVAGATDDQGNFIEDVDSEPETTATIEEEEFFEDDESAAAIQLEDYDPIGYIYCDKTGAIITGGKVSIVSMPAGGAIFFAVDGITGDTLDGRTGYYQFFTNGVPGVYQMEYNHPNGFPMSSTILPEAGSFDPTGLDGSAVDRDGDATNGFVTLGSDVDENYLADITLGANPYYLSFDLEAGDPFIDLNNLPVSCIFIGTVVCEDLGGDGNFDEGIDSGFEGVTVNLYNCADTLTTIATTLSEADGNYRFDGLEAGCYKVRFVIPNNYYIPVDNGIVDQSGWGTADINLTYGQCDTVTTTCFTPCLIQSASDVVENICQGESVQLTTSVTAPTATYTWTPTTGLSDPFIANPVASPYVSTSYIVEINPGGDACIIKDTVRVNVFDVPNPDFHANVACVGQPTVFDDETVTYTTLTGWTWDFGDGIGTSTDQNPSYTYQNAGHYLVKLIVESTNGCRDSSWQEITVSPGVDALAKARQETICEGECVELIAQGGTSFAWSPDATLNHLDCFNPIACPTTTTTYYVDVTNDFGCTARDSVTVTVVPGPTVDVAMTDISECGTRDGSITVTATGLASSYEYSINGGLTYQSSNVFNNLPASSYLVVVRGGSCEVPYPNNPVIIGGAESPAITAVPTVHPSCTADDGTITIEAEGGTNLGYSINGGVSWVTNNEFTDLAGGIYYIAVASADRSCITYYPPVTLVKPEAPVFTDVRFTNPTDCGINDGTVTVIASGNDAIEYGLDDGLMTIWQSSNNFINVPAGDYDVYIRNAGNTCVTPYALNGIRLEDPAAPALTVVAVTQPTDCGTDNATINITATVGSTALEYSIDGGINWNNFAYYENLQPGVYNVFVRNQGGTCEVAYTNNPINISYPDGPTIVEVLHDQPTDCINQNGRIQITAEGGAADLAYSIDGGVTWQESSIFENLSGGIYNIRVANDDESCPAIYPTIELIDAIGGEIIGVSTNGGCEDGSGSLTITATSNTPLEYSIDNGATYQSSNNFFNLSNGSYNVMIRNIDDACPVNYQFNPVIIDRTLASIDNVATTDPVSCTATDGSISVSATGGNLVYSIDGGINYQNTGDFNDLAGGIYNVFVKDLTTGCVEAYEFNPLALVTPAEPTIDDVEVTNTSDCNANDATITVVANGEGGLQYSLDGSTWSNGNSFINLLPGLYNVWVRNNDESCAVPYANNPVVVTAPSGPIITECISANPTDCGVNDGTLTILAVGGEGALQYSIDGGTTWQTSNEFTGLGEGVYSVAVANEDETCIAIYPACQLTAPQPPVVNEVRAVSPSICGEDNGSITILADGNGGLEYSIDNGATWSANSFFGNLPAATYDIQVRNAADNCIVDHGPVTLDAPAAPSIIAGMENVSTCTGSAMPVSITMSEAITQYTIVGSGGYLDANVSGATLTFDAYLNGVVNNFTVTLENADGCTVDHEFAIFQAADPEADFIVHNPTCAETDVTVEFTGDASPGAILTWDLAGATLVSSSAATATAPAGANLVVQWPTPGGKTISLAINDGGCEDRKVQNINVNKLPFADAGLDVSICENECVQLQGIGNGSQYQWSPAIGLSATDIPNPMACPPTTTTYQLLVMGADGCMVMDEVTVSVTGQLTANAGPDQTLCEGESVQLAATGGESYKWTPSTGLSNPNIANPIATPQTVTTYKVEVTNATGCVGTDEVVVTVSPALNIDAGANPEICIGENTMLFATGGISYAWSPATGLSATNVPNPIASPTVTTTYTVEGTDANGCTSTDQVTVLVGANAQANAGADATICTGASTQLNASGGAIYSWNPTVGLDNPNIANPTASPNSTTTYTVTVTNLEGCIGTDQVTVNVNGFIAVNAGADQTMCSGMGALLNATGGVSYVWSPATGLNNTNIANPVASPTQTTTYTVTATSADGCTGTDQVTVNIGGTCDSDGDGISDAQEDLNGNGRVDQGESDPNDPCDPNGAIANAGVDQTICGGSTAFLNASGNGTYSWSPATGLSNPNIANPTANPTATTTYTVTVTSANGCTATDQVTVFVNGNINVGISPNVSVCGSQPVALNATGGTTYSWSPAIGLSNPNIANPIANPTQTTTYCVTTSNAQGCTGTACVTVTVSPGPTVVGCPDKYICDGGNVRLTVNGGVSWVWSPATGLDNPTSPAPYASPAVTTTYTVTGTDAFGCSSSDQVVVFVNGNSAANAGPDQTICAGNTAQLNATGGATYTWSPAFGLSNPNIANPTVSPATTTTYTVQVNSAEGCSGTDQVTVFVNNSIAINAGVDQTICNGSTGASLNATGGSTYTWSPATGLSNSNIANPVANPTVSTTYTVTSTSGAGCSGSDQVTVFVTPGTEVVGCEDKTICRGGSIPLNVTTGVTYLYTPSTGLSDPTSPTPIASPTVTTTYTVYVTDANGCTGSDQITVFVEEGNSANAGVDQTVCSGNTVQLNASGGTSYTWTPTAGLSNPNIANPTVAPTATTTYTVTVTGGAGGCTGSDQVTVFVEGGASANAGPDQTVCAGGSVQLNATGGTSYSWVPTEGLSNPNIANPIASPSNSRTYSVYVTGAGGCTSRDDVVILVTTGGVAVNAGPDQGLCGGGSVQLNATGGSTYSWSPTTGLSNPNIANPTASPSVTTTYTVTSTDAGGCSGTDAVTVTVGSLSVTPSIEGSSCCDDDGSVYLPVIGSSGTLTYNWSPNVANSNTARGLTSGTYRITVTDGNTGCQVITEATVPNTCNTCVAVSPEREVCVDQGATVGTLCLPVRLDEIHNYEIFTPAQVIVPNHGCNFENLTAYSYSLLQGGGNSGPYKIDSWTVNGIVYTGMVNNMTELTAWMHSNDPAGNWANNPSASIVMGGSATTAYGDMKITHQVSWIESTLNPNTTGVATGTEVDVPMGNAESVVVTIRDIRTCCEETVLMKRCDAPSNRCTEEIVSATQETLTITDCNATGSLCVDIPLQEILNYDITADGAAYAGGFRGCDFDTLYAYTYFTMPDQGNSGPYRLRSWAIDGQTYAGDFNNLAELLSMMNAWDVDGNWIQDASTLTLQGGVAARKYGTMDIEQTNTGAFAILELNSNLLPMGTELAFGQGTHNVVFTNKTTGCEDNLTVSVICNEAKTDCEDFIASSSASLTVVSCTDVAAFCVEIPASDLGIYSIELNGSIYTGAIDKCETDGGSIQLYAAEGKNIFTFTNELTECSDQIVVKVNCLQTDGAKVPTLGTIGQVTIGADKTAVRPVAGEDETVTTMNQSARINVTANDRAATEKATLTITEAPKHGTLSINADNTVTYEPKEGYCHPQQADYFKYEICNDEGCDEAQVKVIIDCEPIKVFSAFSPNNDGVNDYFKVEGLEAYPENELKVYNRFGKLLYEQADYQNDWNGDSAGEQLPDGTYFYIINDGKGKQHSGYIQINR